MMNRTMLFFATLVVGAAGGAANAGSLLDSGNAGSLTPNTGVPFDSNEQALPGEQSGAPSSTDPLPVTSSYANLNSEGAKGIPVLGGTSYQYTYNLYVDAVAWAGQSVETGIAGVGRDATNAITAQPSIVYRQGGSVPTGQEGFYVYDYLQNAWGLKAAEAKAGWNTLSIVLNVGTGIGYEINGLLAGDVADTRTTRMVGTLTRINRFQTDGSNSDKSLVVPLPPTVWMGLSLLAGLGVVGYVKRRGRLVELA